MDLEALLILLAIVFVAGGMVGYGIGSVVSKTRRDHWTQPKRQDAIGAQFVTAQTEKKKRTGRSHINLEV
jgi:hypothetical protein